MRLSDRNITSRQTLDTRPAGSIIKASGQFPPGSVLQTFENTYLLPVPPKLAPNKTERWWWVLTHAIGWDISRTPTRLIDLPATLIHEGDKK